MSSYINEEVPHLPTNMSQPHMATNLDKVNCQVCRGTRKLYVEHPDGSLSEEVCTYCNGAGNSVWVKDHFVTEQSRAEWGKILIAAYFGFICWTETQGHAMTTFWTASPGIKIVHFLLWVLIVPCFLWWRSHPKAKTRTRARRGPNPLTTDRERIMGGVVMGGAVLKAEYGKHHPRPR